MGLVADLAASKIVFGNADMQADINNIANEVVVNMHHFEATFSFKFHPTSGPTPPQKTQYWQIGIVQNVLYEKMRFEYENSSPIVAEFVSPAVDSGSFFVFPFANDMVTSTRGQMYGSGVVKPGVMVEILAPVRPVHYNRKGFGQILDPWKSDPDDIVLENAGKVNTFDRPRFGAKLRNRAGKSLVHMQQMVTFGIWLVAVDFLKSRTPQIIAHVEPFTLAYGVDLTPLGSTSLGRPGQKSGFYIKKGTVKTFNRDLVTAILLQPVVKSGSGGRKPVMVGETANTRDYNWANGHLLNA